MPANTKPCARCGSPKGPRQGARYCEDCRRVRRAEAMQAVPLENRKRALRRYSLTLQQYDALLREQGGVCAICGASPRPGARNRVLSVEHDHACCPSNTKSCGQCVRGLVCNRCNALIDMVERHRERIDAYLAAGRERLLAEARS